MIHETGYSILKCYKWCQRNCLCDSDYFLESVRTFCDATIESFKFLAGTGNPGDLPALYAATINDNGKATISRPELITSDSTKLSDKLENADPLHWLNGKLKDTRVNALAVK